MYSHLRIPRRGAVKADGDGGMSGRWITGATQHGCCRKFLSLYWSLVTGLGCNVKSHQAVESAPYSEGHGGAVKQPVRNATL